MQNGRHTACGKFGTSSTTIVPSRMSLFVTVFSLRCRKPQDCWLFWQWAILFLTKSQQTELSGQSEQREKRDLERLIHLSSRLRIT